MTNANQSHDFDKKGKGLLRIGILIGCILLVALMIIGSYYMGARHARLETVLHYKMTECENQIFPFGCKLHNASDTCIVINCQKYGKRFNSAYCFDFENKTYSQLEMIQMKIIFHVAYGCDMELHTIGINPRSGNENWWLK